MEKEIMNVFEMSRDYMLHPRRSCVAFVLERISELKENETVTVKPVGSCIQFIFERPKS